MLSVVVPMIQWDEYEMWLDKVDEVRLYLPREPLLIPIARKTLVAFILVQDY
jgi:hypothetical protein